MPTKRNPKKSTPKKNPRARHSARAEMTKIRNVQHRKRNPKAGVVGDMISGTALEKALKKGRKKPRG